jgi:small subunit ribosomal protein S1
MNTEDTTTTQPEATPPERLESKQDHSGEAPPPQAAPAEVSASHAEAASPEPPAPARPPHAARKAEEYEEEPGDDIGNRLPGARLPDDIGNRRRGGPPGGHRGAPAAGGHRPAPAATPAPEKRPQPAAAAGEAPVAAPAPAAAPEGEGGAAKKRRRRRRRKGAHGVEGAPAAEGAAAEGEHAEGAEGEHDEADEGAEGEHAEGEHAEGEHAEGEHAEGEHAEGEHAEGEHAEGEAGGEKRRRRGKGPRPELRDRPAFSIGEEVFGKVSKVTDAAVWIDIAGKATGLFDRREIMDEEAPVEGDQFIATVASTGVRGGMLMLSRLPLNLEETRKALEAAVLSAEAVTGFVTGAVKGGLEVDLGGLRAFAPASHVDLRHGADLNYLVGQHLDFVVTQYAKKGRDVVVSRRKMLEEESKKARAEAVSKIEPGSVHMGVVRKVVAWGVFIALPDAGNIEGLVHMTEASHDRGARLADLFKQGAEIEVKVLRIDEKGKLWLSRKAVVADPWDAVKEKYSPGSRHKGKVARLQPFGAFIELEPGIDGLIHTGDLSVKPIEHPQEVVKVGDEIEVVVSSCDAHAHKIGLHPAPPPGEELEPRQKVAPHKIVKVAVAQVVEGGLIVRVLGVTGRSSRGFIPAGHTGTARGTDLRKEFPIGTQVEAKIIEIDPRRGEAKLSIRAVKDDAEKQAYQQYRAGVARDAKFGTFADLMKKST